MIGKKRRVLIVEDDSIMGMEIKDALEEWDYEVSDIVSCGGKAVEAAQLIMPDLLLMDIKLKGTMTGFEVAREIRSFIEVPIIFLTGYKDSVTEKQVATIKRAFLITKPFDISQLDVLIKRVYGTSS